MRPVRWLATAIVFAVISTAAQAVEIEVSNAGTDTAACGVGPFSAPPSRCKTIGFAITGRASGGDSVKVLDGTYSSDETFPIVLKDGVSVTGNIATPANVIVDATSRGNVFLIDGPMSASTVLSGFTITTGTTSLSQSSNGIRISDFDPNDAVLAVIEHNRFMRGRHGIFAALTNGTVAGVDLAPNIRFNTFEDIGSTAIAFEATDSGAGQKLSPTIHANTIQNVFGEGIRIVGTSSFEGEIKPVITSNSISGTGGDGIDVSVPDLTSNSNAVVELSPTISGNTIEDVDSDGIHIELSDLSDSNTNAVVRVNPVITGNTISRASSDGIEINISDLRSDITSLNLTADFTIKNNTITDSESEGIFIGITNIDDMTDGVLDISGSISGNVIANSLDDGLELEITSLRADIGSL